MSVLPNQQQKCVKSFTKSVALSLLFAVIVTVVLLTVSYYVYMMFDFTTQLFM